MGRGVRRGGGRGRPQAVELLEALRLRGRETGVVLPYEPSTRFRNTIPPEDELPYPGDMEIERRIKSLIRWNAMAMVHGQNKKDPGIGGHISTYASLATLLEVGYSHFFHAKYTGEDGNDLPGDFIYFQGHASPGVYARAYLEGRLTDEHLKNFRHELRDTPGLSSYPHPWLMPDFWNFPTVSMGIGPINAIYQARFMRYLENRGLIEKTPRKIWAFVGDGETDEVETLGAISLGAREKLDNLIFVVNCNLQRLDGPVRGNKRIIDELEGVFMGAGWNVIKVIWGSGLGRAVCARHERAAAAADGGVRGRRLPDLQGEGRRVSAAAFLRQVSRAAGDGEGLYRRRVDPSAARRARSGEGLQRVQAGGGAQGRPVGGAGDDGEGLRHGRRRSRAMRPTRRRS